MTYSAYHTRELGSVWHDRLDEAGVRVSTIYRESSAREGPTAYYETMAFSLDPERPEILWQSAAGYERAARRHHELAVRWFGSRP